MQDRSKWFDLYNDYRIRSAWQFVLLGGIAAATLIFMRHSEVETTVFSLLAGGIVGSVLGLTHFMTRENELATVDAFLAHRKIELDQERDAFNIALDKSHGETKELRYLLDSTVKQYDDRLETLQAETRKQEDAWITKSKLDHAKIRGLQDDLVDCMSKLDTRRIPPEGAAEWTPETLLRDFEKRELDPTRHYTQTTLDREYQCGQRKAFHGGAKKYFDRNN